MEVHKDLRIKEYGNKVIPVRCRKDHTIAVDTGLYGTVPVRSTSRWSTGTGRTQYLLPVQSEQLLHCTRSVQSTNR